jgi:organic hydroperoxide reductase OsmC/OhrA
MSHTFPLRVAWSGTTATREFTRDAFASAAGKPDLLLSAGDAAVGDVTRWNPEDTLGAALSMCHLLTFLALAAKVGIDVRGYDGHTEAVLDTVDRVTSVTQIILRPTIRVAAGTDLAKAATMFEKAHKYCYIANSIKSEIVMEPTFVEV